MGPACPGRLLSVTSNFASAGWSWSASTRAAKPSRPKPAFAMEIAVAFAVPNAAARARMPRSPTL